MAKFTAEIPYDILNQLEELEKGTMIEEMVSAGADVVLANVQKNIGKAFKSTESLLKGLKKTVVYHTKDNSTSVKVAFYGSNEKGTPLWRIIQSREYGTSRGEAKKPFFRKSFAKQEIESAMMEVQRKYISNDND